MNEQSITEYIQSLLSMLESIASEDISKDVVEIMLLSIIGKIHTSKGD